MKSARILLCNLLGVVSLAGAAVAQEGLATHGTIGGNNTIQQAPSGGSVSGGAAAGGAAAGSAANGQPTQEEQQTEQHNNDVSTICKGC